MVYRCMCLACTLRSPRKTDGWSLLAYFKDSSKSFSRQETPHESEQNLESKRGLRLHPCREHLLSLTFFSVVSSSLELFGADLSDFPTVSELFVAGIQTGSSSGSNIFLLDTSNPAGCCLLVSFIRKSIML